MPRSNDGRWMRICEVCRREFQQRRPGVRTCGTMCRARLPHNTGGLRAKAGLEVRQCQNPECRKEFLPVRETQVACSRKCLRKTPSYLAAQQRTDNRPERRAAQNRRRNLATTVDVGDRRFRNLRSNLRRLHGIDIAWEQYQEWLSRQDGHCKICGKSATGKDGHTDHDRETRQLRDLLCGRCNRGIGWFQEDPELLRAAADYIERHRLVPAT